MTESLSRKAAEAIAADLKGAGYYRDVGLLADFLMAQLETSPGEARRIAKEIHEDLLGASYYRDPDVLEKYLRSQIDEDDDLDVDFEDEEGS